MLRIKYTGKDYSREANVDDLSGVAEFLADCFENEPDDWPVPQKVMTDCIPPLNVLFCWPPEDER